jgi:hypothetical protein
MKARTYEQLASIVENEDEPFLDAFEKLEPLDRFTFATIAFLCMIRPSEWRGFDQADEAEQKRTFESVRKVIAKHGFDLAPEQVWYLVGYDE